MTSPQILFASGARRALLASSALLLAACGSTSPVRWLDADAVPTALASADAGAPTVDSAAFVDAARSALLAALLDTTPRAPAPPAEPLPALTAVPAPNLALGTDSLPADDRACANSWRTARTPRGDVAVWWSEREQRRVHLLAAWRDRDSLGELGAWRGPIPVDTVDVGPADARDADRVGLVGCDRPAPALAVDARNGYVHVTYAMVAPEGGGLFYAHQMDPRAAFEPPVPILYGERLGVTDVAADGDVVAVAYEDPNSLTRPRIGLAVSRLAGHLFEKRVLVDDGEVPAGDPRVAVAGGTIAVQWRVTPRGDGAAAYRSRRAVVQ